MSDPTLSDPQPEPKARRRRLSRKWVVAIAAVVVVALGIGGAAYGVHTKGDAKAKDYAKALDAWNDQKNDLVGAPSVANSDLWDFADATTKKSLAKQKVACKRVLSVRKDAVKDAAAVPTAPDSFVKLLSSDERTAIKQSVARVKAVKAYAKAADKVLAQLRRDCVWNIRVNSTKFGDSGSKKTYAQASKLLLKPGATVGNYYCPSSSKGSCLPATVAGRTQYASLLLKAIKIDKAYVIKRFFTPGTCDTTSYGDLCAVMKKTFSSYYGNFGDYSAVLTSIAPSNAKLKQEIEALKQGNKAADKKFKTALFKAYPEFKSDPRVSKSPFWQEAYFDASAGKSIQGLDKARAALLEMSSNRDSVDALGELSDSRLR